MEAPADGEIETSTVSQLAVSGDRILARIHILLAHLEARLFAAVAYDTSG